MADTDRILSIEDILAAKDIEERLVQVPEWGGAVKIKTISKGRQQNLRKQATVNGEVDPEKLEMLMLAACLTEPAITPAQAEALREKSAAAVDRILREVMGLNGMTAEAQKAATKSVLSGDDRA